MNPPYAVAGAEIEPGMTVMLAPGDDPFVVQKVEPFTTTPNWLLVYNQDNFACVAKANEWYAQVES